MSFGRKIVSAFTLAFAMITLTTFAAAQDNNRSDEKTDKPQKERKFERRGFGERGGGKGMRRGMRGLNKLDLTDAQKEQVRGIMESARTANEPLREEMRTLFEKKRSGEELTEADRARFQELKTRMKESAEQTHNTILGILTAEQREKLEQMKQERKQRREEFRERRQNRQNAPDTTESDG